MESRVGRRERCRAAPWGNDKPRSLRAGFVGEKEVVECGCVWPHASKQASIRDPRFGTLDLGPSICDPRFVTLDLTCAEARHRESDSTWRRIIFFRQREPQVTIRSPLGSTAAPHTLAIFRAIVRAITLLRRTSIRLTACLGARFGALSEPDIFRCTGFGHAHPYATSVMRVGDGTSSHARPIC
jgi:hypothetical protein